MGKVKYIEEIRKFFRESPVVDIESLKKFIPTKDKKYVYTVINSLLKKKEINKITKGYYSIHEDPSLIVYCFKPAYLGLQNALSFHNLWEQETNPVVVTARTLRKGIRDVFGRNVLIRKIDRNYMFGFELCQDGEFYLPYSDIEKTFIDLIYFKQPIDEEALEKIKEKINKEKLNDYLERYPHKFKERVLRLIEIKTKNSPAANLECSEMQTLQNREILTAIKIQRILRSASISDTEKLIKPTETPISMSKEIESLVESLSPIERKILPHLNEKSIEALKKKSELDETSVMRALQFLSNKKIVALSVSKEKIIDLGDNGVLYLKNGLPERRLLHALSEKKEIELGSKEVKLSENEMKAAIGALKKKALIELKNGKIILTANMQEISKKTLEEQFLESLPVKYNELAPEQLYALKSLESRKDIIRIEEKQITSFNLTELGKEIISADLSHAANLIEALTPEMLREEAWRGKRFRKYDISSPVPLISGGKRHFVNQGIEYAKRIWQDMGFEEMSSTLCQTGFWNFDALFTAQDHPVREIQDTFYIKDIKGKLPDKKIVESVKNAHEKGVEKSKGWGGKWNEEEAKRVILRTHTTCLSARTLTSLRNLKNKQGKFFSVGKCFRNETVDWSHGFEFNQTDGIVVDKNANFRHLLGYLKEFFSKMGFDNVKFLPSYFPYTEPSVEIYGYMKEKKLWIEIGGAGIFRPEVVIPLLGEYVPVLAWGPGFDRTLMDYYQIKDLRQFYNNNLEMLRKIKFWIK